MHEDLKNMRPKDNATVGGANLSGSQSSDLSGESFRSTHVSPAPVSSATTTNAMKHDSPPDWLIRSPLKVLADAIQSWRESPTHRQGFLRFATETGGGLIGLAIGVAAPTAPFLLGATLTPSPGVMIYISLSIMGAGMLGAACGGRFGKSLADRILCNHLDNN